MALYTEQEIETAYRQALSQLGYLAFNLGTMSSYSDEEIAARIRAKAEAVKVFNAAWIDARPGAQTYEVETLAGLLCADGACRNEATHYNKAQKGFCCDRHRGKKGADNGRNE